MHRATFLLALSVSLLGCDSDDDKKGSSGFTTMVETTGDSESEGDMEDSTSTGDMGSTTSDETTGEAMPPAITRWCLPVRDEDNNQLGWVCNVCFDEDEEECCYVAEGTEMKPRDELECFDSCDWGCSSGTSCQQVSYSQHHMVGGEEICYPQ